MRDDVHCVEAATAGNGRRHLARGRADGVEEDRLDLGAQMAEEHLEVGDAGVEEEDLAGWLAIAGCSEVVRASRRAPSSSLGQALRALLSMR